MAAANVISNGATATDSSDVTVTTVPAIFRLRAEAVGAQVLVKLKDDASGYNTVGAMTYTDPTYIITAAGTYRFSRLATGSCGVFQG